MRKCNICNNDLYQMITFNNLFKLNYSVHDKCIKSLVINSDRMAFPVTNNLIYYDYLFYEINEKYNLDYLETKYMCDLLNRNINNRDWSIIIFYEEGLFGGFMQSELPILFALSKLPVLIVSLIYHDLSIIFNENI